VQHYLIPPTGKSREILVDSDPAYWAGVKPSTTRAFLKWLTAQVDYSDEGKAWLKRIAKSKGLRFNQGDRYFARALGKSIPATKPGTAAKPLLLQLIKKGK
jgi:hypothetical protein